MEMTAGDSSRRSSKLYIAVRVIELRYLGESAVAIFIRDATKTVKTKVL